MMLHTNCKYYYKKKDGYGPIASLYKGGRRRMAFDVTKEFTHMCAANPLPITLEDDQPLCRHYEMECKQ